MQVVVSEVHYLVVNAAYGTPDPQRNHSYGIARKAFPLFACRF
jgi:hypothetical protein